MHSPSPRPNFGCGRVHRGEAPVLHRSSERLHASLFLVFVVRSSVRPRHEDGRLNFDCNRLLIARTASKTVKKPEVQSSAHRASPAPARLRRGLGGELCDAVLESDRNPSSATQYSDTGRCTQLALNSSAGTKQIPAATRRGKNDTQSYIYGLAPGEARPTDGTMAGGRSLSMSDSLGDAVIRQNIG